MELFGHIPKGRWQMISEVDPGELVLRISRCQSRDHFGIHAIEAETTFDQQSVMSVIGIICLANTLPLIRLIVARGRQQWHKAEKRRQQLRTR